MKLFVFVGLLCASAFASDNPQLKQVQTIYILPMGSGMDQYLANKITRMGLFQIVTDPQRADAILTDRIGEPFEEKLKELYPPPPDEEEKAAQPPQKSGAETADQDKPKSSGGLDFGAPRTIISSFGRGKGNFFLVDRKTRNVLWSVYDRPNNTRSDTLDKTADHIVHRLKHDLKSK